MTRSSDTFTNSKKKSVAPKVCQLPNGLKIQHLNQHETDFLYGEIFEKQVYLKHGITLQEGDCVFDIGANIGLFSLYVLNKYKEVRVFAVEPSPELCEMIRYNTKKYHRNINVLQCGIANEKKEAVFTFYPGYSILSGFNADPDADYHSLRAGLNNGQLEPSDFEAMCLDELAKEKLKEKKDYLCQLKTISDLIQEYQIEKIDLLKIDIEKSEMDALEGIAEADWGKVKQIVMEVHDPDGAVLDKIVALLQAKGFSVEVEAEKNLIGAGIVNLYAINRSQPSQNEILRETGNLGAGTQGINRLSNPERVAIAATFTTEPLLPGLEFWRHELGWSFDIELAPYNQVFQELLQPESGFAKNQAGMNVVLLKLDDWLKYFEKAKEQKRGRRKPLTLTAKAKQQLTQTVAEFIRAIQSYATHSSCFTLLLLCPSASVDAKDDALSSFYQDLEAELEKKIRELYGIDILKARDYHSQYGVTSIFDPVVDQLGHVPFTQEYYHFLATLIIRRFYAVKNSPYKAIALDCDNTLWSGVCGEVGPEGVKVEGIFASCQQYLVTQAEAGALLCLCSKNNAEDVWRVFDESPKMILARKHLVDSRLNWQPKSENIRSLATALNIGTDSFIFIDDNPVECAEVRANCPEVLTLEWPLRAEDDSFINHLWMLDRFQVTEEDRQRKDSYQANIEREKLLESSYDFEDFLRNLKLNVTINPMTEAALSRVSQLTQRTNQFNFSGIRRSVQELRDLLRSQACQCWTVEVSDRFGDYGLVGAVIFKLGEGLVEVDSFFLSCRVLGRGVEHRIMARLGEFAQSRGLSAVKLNYRKTPKNEPVRLFLEQIAKEYLPDNDGTEWEIVIPAQELLNVAFKPLKIEKPLIKAVDSVKSTAGGSELFENLRNKEQLLVRIATQLNNVASITREIDDFCDSNHSIGENKPAWGGLEEKLEVLPAASGTKENDTYNLVLNYVKKVFARELRLSPQELDERQEFAEYFSRDSLKIVAITSSLSKVFPNIQPTILFEEKNLENVTKSIIATNQEIIASHLAAPEKVKAIDGDLIAVSKAHDSDGPQLTAGKDEIAIIGINGRFPGAPTIDDFWRNLREGRSTISEIPDERWDKNAFFDSQGKSGKSYCKWGGFLSDIDRFEVSFFHISPREAETMDPQQRIFLEIVWGLLEDAGYTPKTISRETGVYVGVIASDYGTYTNEAALAGDSGYRNSDYYQIPNRVSYFFDLHGPSLAIDTACSGAGAALHLACQSLKRGECRMAIVGGVNLFLHPGRFIQYAQMQVLSRDAKCRPFGDGATGTIYGEGVGAILLKPLAEAERDGDYIYGVIKGSAINAGGKTNGFTVPNPAAQAELISKALREANIDARTISFVEAHGTGTPLGDPIEITGLTRAFQENSRLEMAQSKPQYCAIGSVKSNIGHLESGAIIAGIIKILLQMKYQMLVPSLNSEKLNPRIKFEETPFYVQQKLKTWERPELIRDGEKITFPRRAGISSFGAGGLNTHFIIEEYLNNKVEPAEDQGPQIIVLSAKNKERLKVYTGKMLDFLEESITGNIGEFSLADLAYTLQIGREAFPERIAILASSIADVIKGLKDYCQDQVDGELVFSSNDRLNQAVQDPAWDSDGGSEAVASRLRYWARQWVSGGEVEWRKLHDLSRRRRIPLPIYPFDGQRYWIGGPGKYPDFSMKGEAVQKIHPLLDSNQSNFYEQIFSKNLSESDLLMKDHVVNGQMILPGVAYFEMARFAGEFSNRDRKVSRISKMVWTRPIILNGCKEVFLSLHPRGQNRVECKSWTMGDDGQRLVHAEWNLEYETAAEDPILAEDLSTIIESCPYSLAESECYQLLGSIGYHYGPSFQVLKRLYYNEKLALARLELQERPDERIGLYPSLLDGALQTITGWISQIREKPLAPYVPFTVGEVVIYKPLTTLCYALVSDAPEIRGGASRIEKYDLKIFNDQGELLVLIKDYYPRPFYTTKQQACQFSEPTGAAKLLYESYWETSKLADKAQTIDQKGAFLIFDCDTKLYKALAETSSLKGPGILVRPGKGFQNLGGNTYEICPEREEDYQLLWDDLEAQGLLPDRILHLWSLSNLGFDENRLESQLAIGPYSILCLSKAITGRKSREPVGILYVFSSDDQRLEPQYAAVSGMVNSIKRENPSLNFKVLNISDGIINQQLISDEMATIPDGVFEIQYRDGTRYLKKYREINLEKEPGNAQTVLIREKGVYLITGGIGGLGLIFAEYLIRKYQARIVLSGRSPLNRDKQAQIARLEALGSQVIYIQADVSKRADVRKLLSEAKAAFGEINGVIHSAGIIKDSLIINQTVAEAREVLLPKVWGTFYLDDETKAETLDFFIMFSSTSSIIGHIGQSSYAYANRFLDEYALLRGANFQKNKCFGKTLVINWPWWQAGGMRIDENTEKYLSRLYGLQGLETKAGLAIFEESLKSHWTRLALIVGDPVKVSRLLEVREDATRLRAEAPLKVDSVGTFGEEDLLSIVIADLSMIVFNILKIPPEDLELQRNFSEFGFDSISFTEFANRINEKYDSNVSPAHFYQHQNMESFVEFLLSEYPEQIENYYSNRNSIKSPMPESAGKVSNWDDTGFESVNDYQYHHKLVDLQSPGEERVNNEPLAIIGMAGIFPQCEDLEEFWDHLVQGHCLITEVPKERWDWEAIYGDPQTPNKTDVKWGGFITDVDKFDPMFFGISPREANLIDPQQRIFLQTVWKAIEDAGYSPSSLSNSKTGLFVGTSITDYEELMKDYEIEIDPFVSSGINNSIIANRVSFLLNIHGPSEVIDTACSSSLVAIRHAVDCLRKGECEMAIAGGVNVILSPKFHISFRKAGMLSPDGLCKTFDANADGYVRGEGAGAILIKPLSRAIKDGDHIYAVIKGVAENHGGHAQSLTAPNPKAQAEVLANAYLEAGIPIETVGYIEAHGTGTSLGDPIEIEGLKEAFRKLAQGNNKSLQPAKYCGLGSVKTNIGHLECASGIAGVIKVLLALEHKTLPATINFKTLNPYIDLEDTPFYIVTNTQPWEPMVDENGSLIPRRAGISSFGFGGTNAHVVLEEYQDLTVPRELADDGPQIFVLSARTEERLREYALKFKNFLEKSGLTATTGATDEVTLIEEFVVKRVSSILNIPESALDRDEALINHGFDIYTFNELSKAIEAQYSLELPGETLLGSINSLISYIRTAKTGGNNFTNHLPAGVSLRDIAFTLQIGRDPLAARLAIPASNIEELTAKLDYYCQHGKGGEGIYYNHLKAKPGAAERKDQGDSWQEYFASLVNKGEYHQIAQLWVNGKEIEWRQLHSGSNPKRVSLPTYPFARERYWLPQRQSTPQTVPEKTMASGVIHPSSVSYYEQKWELANLVTEGSSVIPGATYLVFDTNDAIVDYLLAAGIRATLIKPGDSFRNPREYLYEVNPERPEDFEKLWDQLLQNEPSTTGIILHLWSNERLAADENLLQRGLQQGVYSLFHLVTTLMKRKLFGKVHLSYIYPRYGEQSEPQYAAVNGFLKTLHQENPLFSFKTIEFSYPYFDSEVTRNQFIETVLREAQPSQNNATEIRYENEHRFRKVLQEIGPCPDRERPLPLKEEGVYLITGGMGGLGYIFAKHLAERFRAKLVLVGRSDLTAEKIEKISYLESLGAEVIYLKADVASRSEVNSLISEAKKRFTRINGVIHCAGVIRDAFLLRKTKQEMDEVLASKVYGTVWLDYATRQEQLDFFVLFSSLTGVVGNPGQSDYAFANSFLDNYAVFRGASYGKSLSLAWPLWKDGGMGISAPDFQILNQRTGLELFPSDEGIKAWELLLGSSLSQCLVVYGGAQLRNYLSSSFAAPVANVEVAANPGISRPVLAERTGEFLKTIFADIFGIPTQQLDLDTGFEEYGLNSILINQFNAIIQSKLGKLPKTLLFECWNLTELIEHMVNNYQSKLIEVFGPEGASLEKTEATKVSLRVNEISGPVVSVADGASVGSFQDEEIAIIGVSGRYPMAENLEEYWENLKSGRDCITEVPIERWDYHEYYHHDPGEAKNGKIYCKWGGFLDGATRFDPLLFNISPREAELMDPQERIFLETAWATLEDSGYTRKQLQKLGSKFGKANVGVFVGVTTNTYQLWGPEEWRKGHFVVPKSLAWTIASRVSYVLNLHGPSLAVDTACSSSLTAIHLACQSLKKGECRMAIAGGVNLYLHPAKYMEMCQVGMLSPTGKCNSFGENGNGFVPGEGVGAVLLKPLTAALRDGDYIYAVIKGSSINHGGTTNGYTVPNPTAQAELIINALTQAKVDPRTISYIEAHGTGTALGDPIEISGLTKAFREFTDTQQFCSIGSVKSNIGHLEAAAGIAGLTKIILQMKHGYLAPSLNATKLNQNINFEESPFSVQQKLEPWKPALTTEGGVECQYPRRAALSSFGAGGSNAHLIVEEYPRASSPGSSANEPQLIVLSAKTEERLRTYAGLLAQFLEKNADEYLLSDIAYTLQIGREAMEERLAIISDSISHLCRKLKDYQMGIKDDCYCGNIKNKQFAADLFLKGDEGEAFLQQVIENQNLKKLAQLWVLGIEIDWNLIHHNSKRVPLPTYPFAGTTYWIPEATDLSEKNWETWHPLIDRINPDLSFAHHCFVFEKVLHGNNRIIADHKVWERAIFPGVGYLEMAAAAVAKLGCERTVFLSNVLWLRPIEIDHSPKTISLFLSKGSAGYHYEIRSNSESGESILHSRGNIALNSTPNNGIQQVSLTEIKERSIRHLNQEAIYEKFTAMGLNYGRYFQGLAEIWGNDQEALGYIKLPQGLTKDFASFLFHPTLTDGALQTAIGITTWSNLTGALVPFSVDQVEVFQPLRQSVYTYAQLAGNNKFHVALLDETGRVCIKFHNVTVRKVKNQVSDFCYVPVWEEKSLTEAEAFPIDTKQKARKVLVFYTSAQPELMKVLVKRHEGDQVTAVELKNDFSKYITDLDDDSLLYFLGGIDVGAQDPEDLKQLETGQEQGVLSLFRLTKALSAAGYGETSLTIKVVTNNVYAITAGETIKPNAASLHGMVKSLAKEYPHWQVSCIDIDLPDSKSALNLEKLQALADGIIREPANPRGNEIVIRGMKRYLRSLYPARIPSIKRQVFRTNGVYLILGGAGGIGLELASYLAKEVQARLVLVGRSELKPDQLGKISRIEATGGKVLYVKADATNLEEMRKAVATAEEVFGEINGVIHGAIVLRDKLIRNLDEESFRAALAPKVIGSVVLQKVFAGKKLDFMAFFSSAQSFVGNPGQSNYSAGCAFKDAFAAYLQSKSSFPILVFNWGYWGTVGVAANEEYNKRFAMQGVGSISPYEGMEIFKRTVAHCICQVAPLKAENHVLSEIGVDFSKQVTVLPVSYGSLVNQINEKVSSDKKINISKTGIKVFQDLERFGYDLALNLFWEMGGFTDKGRVYQRSELIRKMKVKRLDLFDKLLRILAQADLIRIEGEIISLTENVAQRKRRLGKTTLESRKKQLKQKYPDLQTCLDLAWSWFDTYPQLLTGAQNSGDLVTAAGLRRILNSYAQGIGSNSLNETVVTIVKEFILKRLAENPGAKTRIHAFNLGMGMNHELLFNMLTEFEKNIEYCYSDLAAEFNPDETHRYEEEYPFVKICEFSLDNQFKQKNLGRVDLILFTNAASMTSKLQVVMDYFKKLLHANGLLIIDQPADPPSLIRIAMELFAAGEFFPTGPGLLRNSALNQMTWMDLLSEHGFRKVHRIIGPDLGEDATRHQIIIGESDGYIVDAMNKATQIKVAPIEEKPVRSLKPVLAKPMRAIRGKEVSNQSLKERTVEFVKTSFAKVLKMKPDDIDSEATFETFGVDSVFTLEITKNLEQTFGKLSATVLFENMTIEKLSQYFIANYRERLLEVLSFQNQLEDTIDNEGLFYDASAAVRESPEEDGGETFSNGQAVPEVQTGLPGEALQNIDNLSEPEIDLLLKQLLQK